MTRRQKLGPIAIAAASIAEPEDFDQLRALGYIAARADGSIVVTDAGMAALQPMPDGEGVYWDLVEN